MGLRDIALRARVAATASRRRARMETLCRQGKAPMFVPFYHRVADQRLNDWTISRSIFAQQVDYCLEHFDPVGLDEVQRRVRNNESHRPTITFTFDDGYAENCEYALPLLVEKQMPTVYFVTVNCVKDQSGFPHDDANGCSLPVNTVDQVRQFSDLGIEIGLHTRSHADFAKVFSADQVRSEIIEAKDELEQMIGRKVRYFAFPFGMPPQLTQAAIEAVYEAGLWGFCSAFGAYNLPGRDAFHIRRFHGDGEFNRFLNWTSFDPQKVHREPTIRYFLPPATSFAETVALMTV
ncbi:MAG: polysaccharide deacetylase family protein [Pirellulaceae bacterium]